MIRINDFVARISIAALESKLDSHKIGEIIDLLDNEQNRFDSLKILLIIDQEAVCGLKHLEACIYYTLKSFEQGTNIANNLGPELLLYLAGRRQISKSIKNIGLSINTTKILMIELFENEVNCDTKKLAELLQELDLAFKGFKFDIDMLPITDYSKIKKNLEITEEMISVLTTGTTSENYSDAIEKLAIERSAILNLQK